MIACPKFFEVKIYGSFFQKKITNELILGVCLISNIGLISCISHRSKSGYVLSLAKIITLWNYLNKDILYQVTKSHNHIITIAFPLERKLWQVYK